MPHVRAEHCTWRPEGAGAERDVLLPADLNCAQSCPTLKTPWSVVCQAPLSMGFSRQEYWSGLPFPSPGDLPGPGMEPGSPALLVDSLPSKPLVVPISYPRADGLFL